jgi:hypothetical protein
MYLEPRSARAHALQAVCQLAKFGALTRWRWVMVEHPIDVPSSISSERLLAIAQFRFFIPPSFKYFDRVSVERALKMVGECIKGSSWCHYIIQNKLGQKFNRYAIWPLQFFSAKDSKSPVLHRVYVQETKQSSIAFVIQDKAVFDKFEASVKTEA